MDAAAATSQRQAAAGFGVRIATAIRSAVNRRPIGVHPHFRCCGVSRALIRLVARGQRDADLEPIDAVGPGRAARRGSDAGWSGAADHRPDHGGPSLLSGLRECFDACAQHVLADVRGLALAGPGDDVAGTGAPLPVQPLPGSDLRRTRAGAGRSRRAAATDWRRRRPTSAWCWAGSPALGCRGGCAITLRQGKSARSGRVAPLVTIPCTQALRRMLDGMEHRSPLILTTKTGRALQKRYFARLWEEAATKAGVGSITLPGLDAPVALHFHDLRGTAVTMLSEAGCSVPQIATITGHSLKTVTVILDRYLARTRALADQAIFNWENSPRTEFANQLQTVTPTPKASKGKTHV